MHAYLMLFLLMLPGTVVNNADNGGSIFLDNAEGKLVTSIPSSESLTDALKPGGDLLGFFQTTGSKGNAYFTEEFNVSNISANNYILKYYVKQDFKGYPVKIAIYKSGDLKGWEKVKEEVSSIGWHNVSIGGIDSEKLYIKFVALEPYGSSQGASMIDEVRIVEGSLGPTSKLDFNSMQVKIANGWLSFPWVVVLFFASLIGANIVSQGKFALVAAAIGFLVPFVVDIFFSLNIYFLSYLMNDPLVLTINSLIFGVAVSLTLHIQQRK